MNTERLADIINKISEKSDDYTLYRSEEVKQEVFDACNELGRFFDDENLDGESASKIDKDTLGRYGVDLYSLSNHVDFENLEDIYDAVFLCDDDYVKSIQQRYFDEGLDTSSETTNGGRRKFLYGCDDCGYEVYLYPEENTGACPNCGEHHGFYSDEEIDEELGISNDTATYKESVNQNDYSMRNKRSATRLLNLLKKYGANSISDDNGSAVIEFDRKINDDEIEPIYDEFRNAGFFSAGTPYGRNPEIKIFADDRMLPTEAKLLSYDDGSFKVVVSTLYLGDTDEISEVLELPTREPEATAISVVDLIRRAYDSGRFDNLKCVGRDNACTFDIHGPDKERIISFFDKKEEFNREDHNDSGVNSVEFISDKFDIEIFDNFIRVYKIPQNESAPLSDRIPYRVFVKGDHVKIVDGGKTGTVSDVTHYPETQIKVNYDEPLVDDKYGYTVDFGFYYPDELDFIDMTKKLKNESLASNKKINEKLSRRDRIKYISLTVDGLMKIGYNHEEANDIAIVRADDLELDDKLSDSIEDIVSRQMANTISADTYKELHNKKNESLNESILKPDSIMQWAVAILYDMDKYVLDVYDNEEWLVYGVGDGEFEETTRQEVKDNYTDHEWLISGFDGNFDANKFKEFLDTFKSSTSDKSDYDDIRGRQAIIDEAEQLLKDVNKTESLNEDLEELIDEVGDKLNSLSASTRLKRVANWKEFDNGNVLFDYKELTDDEAENAAKEASIKDPTNIYYVKYDDIMNPSSDLRWINGESYDYGEYKYIGIRNGKPCIETVDGETICLECGSKITEDLIDVLGKDSAFNIPDKIKTMDIDKVFADLKADIKTLVNCDSIEEVKNATFNIYNYDSLIERHIDNGKTFSEAQDATISFLIKVRENWLEDLKKLKEKAIKSDNIYNKIADELNKEYPIVEKLDTVITFKAPENATQDDCIAFVDKVVKLVNGKYSGTGRGGSWTMWDILTEDGIMIHSGWGLNETAFQVQFPDRHTDLINESLNEWRAYKPNDDEALFGCDDCGSEFYANPDTFDWCCPNCHEHHGIFRFDEDVNDSTRDLSVYDIVVIKLPGSKHYDGRVGEIEHIYDDIITVFFKDRLKPEMNNFKYDRVKKLNLVKQDDYIKNYCNNEYEVWLDKIKAHDVYLYLDKSEQASGCKYYVDYNNELLIVEDCYSEKDKEFVNESSDFTNPFKIRFDSYRTAVDIADTLGFSGCISINSDNKGYYVTGDETTLHQFIDQYNKDIGELDLKIEESKETVDESDSGDEYKYYKIEIFDDIGGPESGPIIDKVNSIEKGKSAKEIKNRIIKDEGHDGCNILCQTTKEEYDNYHSHMEEDFKSGDKYNGGLPAEPPVEEYASALSDLDDRKKRFVLENNIKVEKDGNDMIYSGEYNDHKFKYIETTEFFSHWVKSLVIDDKEVDIHKSTFGEWPGFLSGTNHGSLFDVIDILKRMDNIEDSDYIIFKGAVSMEESFATTAPSISDLKSFFNTSDTLKSQYANFFEWFDEMVKTGRFNTRNLRTESCDKINEAITIDTTEIEDEILNGKRDVISVDEEDYDKYNFISNDNYIHLDNLDTDLSQGTGNVIRHYYYDVNTDKVYVYTDF